MNSESIRTLVNDQTVLAWLSWIGLVIGLLGLVLSYYFYAKAERAKKPYCLTFTQTIAGHMLASVPELKITYRQRPILRLTITKLVFWNAGAETIQSQDVPSASPFRIALPKGEQVLNHKLEFVKKRANAVQLDFDVNENAINVIFDYFDKNDGFVVEILHTAKSDSALQVDAVFKGARTIVRRSAAPFLSLPKWIQKFLASDQRSLAGLSLIAVAILSWSDRHYQYIPTWLAPLREVPPAATASNYLAEFLLYGGLIFAGAYLFRTRLPKGFDLNW